MSDVRAAVATGVIGLGGLVLLLLESVRALTGDLLSTTATILLFVGMGLIALCGLLTVVRLWRSPAGSAELAS